MESSGCVVQRLMWLSAASPRQIGEVRRSSGHITSRLEGERNRLLVEVDETDERTVPRKCSSLVVELPAASSIPLEEKQRFCIREGGRTVALGQVAPVLG